MKKQPWRIHRYCGSMHIRLTFSFRAFTRDVYESARGNVTPMAWDNDQRPDQKLWDLSLRGRHSCDLQLPAEYTREVYDQMAKDTVVKVLSQPQPGWLAGDAALFESLLERNGNGDFVVRRTR